MFLHLWGWPPTVVDDMTRTDFLQCKAIADNRLQTAREQTQDASRTRRSRR